MIVIVTTMYTGGYFFPGHSVLLRRSNLVLHFFLYGMFCYYPRRARSALGVDTVLTLDVCLYVCMYVC